MLPSPSVPLVERIRDAAARLQLTPAHVAALLVLASCACAGLVALSWTARPVPIAAPAPVLPSTPADGATDEPGRLAVGPSAGPVVVHVSGAVASEGVIELAAGSRVIDAVQAAGGPRRRARTEQLNLARVLRDGEQIHVPTTGSMQVPAPDPGGGDVAPGGAVGGIAAPGAAAVVDLNTASAAELETLPDIGPVLAGRIVAHRDSIGGFTSVEQLLDVDGIGDKTFAALHDLVTV
ncbi:MAG TPA: helix-hairpin-helix domain-containing protein [Euzebyales bacterium]|nr:helix-hairpin-helix domain-containing protein [Euzebyales bacterium]